MRLIIFFILCALVGLWITNHPDKEQAFYQSLHDTSVKVDKWAEDAKKR